MAINQAKQIRPVLEILENLQILEMSPVCKLADCETAAADQSLCSQCKLVNYCGKEHQKEDWARHKPECLAASETPIPVAPAGHWAMDTPPPSFPLRQWVDMGNPWELRELDFSKPPPPPHAWSMGLSPHMQREWLVDCYRMRLDDELVWQNNIRPGSLYDQSGAREIAQDFLVFCCLVRRKGVLPENWIWSQFLDVAAELLAFKFEKNDAKIKYGGENQFALLHGGRSLRWF